MEADLSIMPQVATPPTVSWQLANFATVVTRGREKIALSMTHRPSAIHRPPLGTQDSSFEIVHAAWSKHVFGALGEIEVCVLTWDICSVPWSDWFVGLDAPRSEEEHILSYALG